MPTTTPPPALNPTTAPTTYTCLGCGLTVNITAVIVGNIAGRRVYAAQRAIDAFYTAHPEFLAAATVGAQELLPRELRDELALLYRASEYAVAGPVRVADGRSGGVAGLDLGAVSWVQHDLF